VNSRLKGKRGELAFAHLLRENGFDARRGQQFAGGMDSPDIISQELNWLHMETKHVEKLNLLDACAQAESDCGGKPWIVAHHRNRGPWLITMRAETFFEFLRGKLPPENLPAAVAASADNTKNKNTNHHIKSQINYENQSQ
jgi:hypothetical protein